MFSIFSDNIYCAVILLYFLLASKSLKLKLGIKSNKSDDVLTISDLIHAPIAVSYLKPSDLRSYFR